jgi:hypothetical protein
VLAYLTPEQMPKQSHSVELFGWKLAEHTRLLDVTRRSGAISARSRASTPKEKCCA